MLCRSQDGITALMHAASLGKTSAVKKLIDKKADVEIEDKVSPFA